MTVSFRRHWLLALALPLLLTACGSSEPDQRAAFKQFLQTRIIDKPGVHVPKLTPEESKSFGDYTQHYAVITDFNSGMDASIKPLNGFVQKGAFHSLGDVIERRDDLKTVQTGVNDLVAQLKQQLAKADTAHAQLKQPDDLKTVYDSAYDRTVTVPANTLLTVMPQVNGTFESGLKVADYVDAHKAQIQINGSVIQVTDPKVQAELNTLLQDLNAKAKVVQEAQTRMQAVLLGR
jgi:hypothetical protein